jgi:hypothetical protein
MIKLAKELPDYVAIRHEDVRTSGIPDLSISGNGATSWWEFKHATPSFEYKGVQHDTMLRLALQSHHARYIVYWETASGLAMRTMIVHPADIATLDTDYSTKGHDHGFVVDYIRNVHR